MKKVLVACEESQAVCIELRLLGFESYSCDLQDCSGGHPEWHIKDDVIEVIKNRDWDAIIAFPPCTHLSSAGAPSWKQKQADGRQREAIDFVMSIYNSDCDKIAIENPVGILNTKWRKPDQIVNPFQFGDPYKKRTCFWLKGFKPLEDTLLVEPIAHWTSNSTRGGILKDGTRKKSKLPIRKGWDSAKERSKTFKGIAKAIAEQWGAQI